MNGCCGCRDWTGLHHVPGFSPCHCGPRSYSGYMLSRLVRQLIVLLVFAGLLAAGGAQSAQRLAPHISGDGSHPTKCGDMKDHLVVDDDGAPSDAGADQPAPCKAAAPNCALAGTCCGPIPALPAADIVTPMGPKGAPPPHGAITPVLCGLSHKPPLDPPLLSG